MESSIPKLNPSTTAILLMDFQPLVFARLSPEVSSQLTAHVSSLLMLARSSGLFVTHVHVAFTEEQLAASGSPSNKNKSVQPLAANPAARERLLAGNTAATQIPGLGPKDGEFSVTKIRVGPFLTGPGVDILKEWKERGIDQVIVAGIITSGCVLSAVRQLADLDFGLYVVEDCCADGDAEVHKMLMEKVFPMQAFVIKESDVKGLIAES
jgi:nicotinamidase-related amidase